MIGVALYCLMALASSTTETISEPLPGFLALGDSYTVGEGLPTPLSWPYQLHARLQESSTGLAELPPPAVIARTGWTTDELSEGITRHTNNAMLPADCYPLVTLSIGVNDQYRGRPVEQFEQGFSRLLATAIAFADSDPSRVMVLSIPDWGQSPFALRQGADRPQVSQAIDLYNTRKRALAAARQVTFIDITDATRQASWDDYAADGLHPGEKIYADWVQLVADSAQAALSRPKPCEEP